MKFVFSPVSVELRTATFGFVLHPFPDLVNQGRRQVEHGVFSGESGHAKPSYRVTLCLFGNHHRKVKSARAYATNQQA